MPTVDDLTGAKNDGNKRPGSMGAAFLFLDNSRLARRWPALGPRPKRRVDPGHFRCRLPDICVRLDYAEVCGNADEVLPSLNALKNAWPGQCPVEILPFHTVDEGMDSVVPTFVDLARQHLLEQQLMSARPSSSTDCRKE